MTKTKKLVQKIYNKIEKLLGIEMLEVIYQAKGCIILTSEKIYLLFDKPTLDDTMPKLKEYINNGIFISYPKEIQEINDEELEINVQNIIINDEKELLEVISEVKKILPEETLIRKD